MMMLHAGTNVESPMNPKWEHVPHQTDMGVHAPGTRVFEEMQHEVVDRQETRFLDSVSRSRCPERPDRQ